MREEGSEGVREGGSEGGREGVRVEVWRGGGSQACPSEHQSDEVRQLWRREERETVNGMGS